MAGYALFIQHRTQPGKRNEVQAVWRKHMQPAIATNEGHLAYFYTFGTWPDEINAFQHYRDAASGAAFLKTPAYAAYLAEVEPLLLGDPLVTVLDVQWVKPGPNAG